MLAPGPQWPEATLSRPLLARLEPVSAPSPPAPPARPTPLSRPQPHRPAPRPAPKPAPAEPAAEVSDSVAHPSETVPANPSEPAAADTASAADQPASEALAAPRPPLPARIRIGYTLIKGEQGLVVGRMTHDWEAADGQYTVTSLARATGLFSLFVPGTLIQVSRGELVAEGLKPQLFWIQRGQSGNRTETASFDWGAGSLRFGRPGEEKTVPLPAGAQDVLSVLYQLAYTAPHTGVLELAVTNGRKFDHYRYRVAGEETLDTPLGPLVTERLERVRSPGEDGLELWLARDYRYLPVKLRFIDRKGEVAEQLVEEIRAE